MSDEQLNTWDTRKCQRNTSTEWLVKSLPEVHIETIDIKTRLVFNRKVKELIGEHVKCPNDFLFSL